MSRSPRVCSRCVMDTTDPGIVFDADGFCNHCRDYTARVSRLVESPEAGERALRACFDEIRAQGRGRLYDCLLGVSGGVDSSHLALLAWSHGLRAMLIHMDNAWDSEAAVGNIERIIQRTGFDYYNHVIDWDEFRDIQLAYIRASVVDIEVVTDHAIKALGYQLADKFGIRVILQGINPFTEHIMPRSWLHDKNDLANLKAIHARYGTLPLRTYPTLGKYRKLHYNIVRGISEVTPLALIRYDHAGVRERLRQEFSWIDPGGKHYESIFTRFYQCCILPRKFGIDKRKAHFSTLIMSGQMTREEAMARLQDPPCDPEQMAADREFVLKKLGLAEEEFEEIMRQPRVEHHAFPSDRLNLFQRFHLTAWNRGRMLARRFTG